jgi:hypothetical protein
MVKLCPRCNGTGFDGCNIADLFEPEDFFSPPIERDLNAGTEQAVNKRVSSPYPGGW